MEDLIVLAETLTAQGKMISIKPNSIFAAAEFPGATDKDLTELIAQVANKLRNELILFRTKINPLLGEYVEKLTDEVSRLRDTSETSKYTIIESKFPEIAIELNSRKKANNTTGSLPLTNFMFDTPSTELLRTSFVPNLGGELKTMAKEYVDQFSDQDLLSVWSKYLTNLSSDNKNITILSDSSLTSISDLCLLILSVTYLKDNKPSSVNMTENSYSEIMNKVINELYGYLNYGFDTYSNYLSTGRVIIRVVDKYTAYVHPDVYTEFLKAGGKPELILGYLVEGDNAVNRYKDALLNNADLYARAWNRKYDVSRLAAMESNVRAHKTIHTLYVQKFFKELLPPDLLQYVKIDTLTAEKEVTNLIKETPDSEILDVEKMSRYVFGKVYFNSTNYLRFTEYMLEHMALLKDTDLKKAASYASLDLIMDYFGSQVTLSAI